MMTATEIEFHGVKIKGFQTKSGFVEVEKLIEFGFKNLDKTAIDSAKAELFYNTEHEFGAMLETHKGVPKPIPEETKLEFRKKFIPYLWDYLRRQQATAEEFLNMV